MKRLVIAIAAVFAVGAPAAFAQYDRYDRDRDYRDNSYNTYNNYDNRDYSGDRARVLDVRPVTEAANQREECWNPRAGHYEEVRKHDENKRRVGAGTVIGGIAGGILGHQLGSGAGNTAATVGGAALGAYAGNRVEKNRTEDDQPDLDRTNCRVVGDAGSNQMFDVRYSWNGREYVARMDHDPGRYVELGRDVNADGTPFS